MKYRRMKRFITDPTTGMETMMTTTNKSGRVEWIHTREWDDDKLRAIEKSKKKEEVLNVFRRAIDV